ncbi:hypothetical protein BBP00_00009337 [Phytophthora kernoviae]|uniref:Annexin n=1 Tax=Phytophthora kernoviae TaxID=325452 RepID=A0A3F2RCX9_9STRA|nr:hypothetical protein BBP00_00009337 [Phytophthora kernoviae]
MGGAESTEMDSKKQQQQAAAGGKPTPTETRVKTVEGGVTTYTTTAGVKTAVSDFEAVSEQKSSKGPGAEPETEPSDRQKAAASGDDDVKTEVFRVVETDGCVVVKTVKTTRRSTVSATGEPMTTVEVETTIETEDTNGDITTSTKTETTTETESKRGHNQHDAKTSTSTSGITATNSSNQASTAPGELVMIEVFQSEEADGTIVTKTVKTTTRTSTTANGELMTTKAAAIGVAGLATTGAVIGSAVSATRSKTTSDDVGSTETTETTNVMEKGAVRGGGSLVKSYDDDAFVVVELSGDRKIGSKLMGAQDLVRSLSVMPQFVDFCGVRGQKPSNLESENLYEDGSLDEKRAAWNFSRTLSVHVPELAVHQFGVEVGRHKRVLIIKEVSSDNEKASKAANIEVLTPLLNESPQLSSGYENVVITEGGKVVFYGSAKSLMAVSEQLGLPHPQENEITGFLLGLSDNSNAQYHVTIIDGANDSQDNQRSENLSSQVNFADDAVLFASDSVMASQATKKFAGDDTKLDHREDNQSSSYTASPALVTAGTAAMRGLGELSGDLKKVILTAMRGEVVAFDASVHTSAKVAADVDALYKAGEGKWGTDEEPFIRIVVLSPSEHLRNIDAAYSKKYKKTSVIKAIKGEFKGDAQAALLYHVRMVFEPFELLADLFESTMKGLGTDEYGLSAAVVRYHVMLPQVKTAYKKLYGKELSKRIRGDTSGEYRDLLLAIVDDQ